MLSFMTNSLSFGKSVAVMMKNISPTSAQLFSTNAASRLRTASICPWLRNCGRRQTIRPIIVAITIPMNHTKYTPMSLCAKLCTLDMRPERVRNVPKIVRKNVSPIRKTFQTLSIPRRSWIIVECR